MFKAKLFSEEQEGAAQGIASQMLFVPCCSPLTRATESLEAWNTFPGLPRPGNECSTAAALERRCKGEGHSTEGKS